MKKVLDNLPMLPLAAAALFLAFAPFQPEPHLWQKLKMLSAGTLEETIDIFDLLMHATPLVILLAKLAVRNKVE